MKGLAHGVFGLFPAWILAWFSEAMDCVDLERFPKSHLLVLLCRLFISSQCFIPGIFHNPIIYSGRNADPDKIIHWEIWTHGRMLCLSSINRWPKEFLALSPCCYFHLPWYKRVFPAGHRPNWESQPLTWTSARRRAAFLLSDLRENDRAWLDSVHRFSFILAFTHRVSWVLQALLLYLTSRLSFVPSR